MSENNTTSNKQTFRSKISSYFKPKGIEIEMLRYRPNKVSYNFDMFGIIFIALGFAVLYSTLKTGSMYCTFDIIYNILVLLFLFMAAEKMKVYSKSWGIFTIGAGIFQAIRIFLFPLAAYNAGSIPGTRYTLIIIYYLISAVFLIIAGFISIYRGITLKRYLKTVTPIENEQIKGGK